MNSRRIIHLLLIVALGFSQLAANIHVASHFQAAESLAATTKSGQQSFHNHLHFAADGMHALGEHPSLQAQPSTDTAECAVYHVYVGLNGCVNAAQSWLAVPLQHVVAAAARPIGITVNAADRLRIRGPPKYS